ncbi:hypothetical protein [Methanohalobium evestigatum]|uniref:hypothetical protein n=1 Tax=Methanohalobium evestigatum TaxID=2322 RepID=UPI0012F6BDA4|nr:hypothetical protein [Methanohalobium evestigatum]
MNGETEYVRQGLKRLLMNYWKQNKKWMNAHRYWREQKKKWTMNNLSFLFFIF